ncbi:hypothetical protein B6I21_04240 [candidate division KSB1 bacterium 4572_119]|nr:MAG: hypothetical protein B6I21_04240 [candidate division KSB1 bacterium 4572_119]
MTFDAITGIILILLAYGIVLFLTLWSRSTIEKISKLSTNSLREIITEFRHGRSKTSGTNNN